MFLYRFLRFFLFWASRLFFHLEVRGREYIPKEGGFILASNHASFLDPILLGVACPRILNFAARDSLFKIPLFGLLIFNVGAFPIKRWSADLSAVRESVRRLQAHTGLVVFPEGTRSVNGQLQAITHGFVLLASKAGVPIVPVWIKGSYKAWGRRSPMIRPSKITVVFGQPVTAVRGMPYPEVAQEIQARIRCLSGA